MPEQYCKSRNREQLQLIMGLGMLAISVSLVAFALVFPLVSKDMLSWFTSAFVIAINIEAFTMVFLLYRGMKKTS